MSDQTQPSIGTVAEEAARLISAMATMARAGAIPSDEPTEQHSHTTGPYAGGPAGPAGQDGAAGQDGSAQVPGPTGSEQADRACSACGRENEGTPVACRLCPLCQGIALLRSVRPETVDRLADLVSAMADSLRDLASQSRASTPDPESRSRSGGPSDRAPVQDIPVDDEDAG